MRPHALLAAALLLFAIALPTLAQETEASIPLSWFDEAPHHAKQWKVSIQPDLNYNQRFSIGLFASIPAPKKSDSRGSLYLIVRAADEHGKFFDGGDSTRVDLNSLATKTADIRWHTNFYVKPGAYQVVLLVFDARSNQHFLWRETIRVDRPHVLPDLDRDMPRVEFVQGRSRHAPVGEHLPIDNQRPLRIDVIMNLTGDQQMSLASGFYSRLRQFSLEGALVGAVSVMSQMQPTNGCVRISAIDIVHLQVARDRAVADTNVDWQQVRATIIKNRDTQTVDLKTLTGRQKAREFFRQYIDKVVSDDSGCGSGRTQPDRAVIVVSDALEFPKGTDKEPVAPPEQRGGRFYHVKIAFRGPTFDNVGHMLDTLHPRRFTVNEPKDLRRAIAEIIHDLEQPAPATRVQ